MKDNEIVRIELDSKKKRDSLRSIYMGEEKWISEEVEEIINESPYISLQDTHNYEKELALVEPKFDTILMTGEVEDFFPILKIPNRKKLLIEKSF